MYVFDSFWHLKITQDLTVICLVEWDFFCNLICLVTMSAEKALCFSTRGFFGFLVESRDICPTRQIDSKVDVDGRNNLPQMHPGKMAEASLPSLLFKSKHFWRGPSRVAHSKHFWKCKQSNWLPSFPAYLLTWCGLQWALKSP